METTSKIQQILNSVVEKCGGKLKKILENKSKLFSKILLERECYKKRILFDNKGNFNIKTIEFNDL